MPDANRFRNSYDYAESQGLVGGFPNFHQADYGDGVVMGTLLVGSGATWRDVSASDLGNPGTFEERFRSVHSYATANGFVGGFPNFHQGNHGAGLVYGTILLTSALAEWRDVRAADLGNPATDEDRFRAVHSFATANGYVGGFPNFHQANRESGVVYGTILLKRPAEWRDVFAEVMAMFSWPFAAAYSRGQRLTVLERHTFAYSRIKACGTLNSTEKSNLFTTYKRAITHGVDTDPNNNASSTVGGSAIDINFTNWFGNTANEQAQTLIHEMMHCAGYTHPDRQTTDVPGDNGPYYATPPLQSEICIAGIQSDTLCSPASDGRMMLLSGRNMRDPNRKK